MSATTPYSLVYLYCELCKTTRRTTMAKTEARQFLKYGVGTASDPIILNHLFCNDPDSKD